MNDKFSVSLGNILTILILLGAIAGSWYSISTRVTVLELQAKDAREDHATVEKLKSVMLATNPQSLEILGAQRVTVHTFGAELPAAAAADAAQMPKAEKK